ncbi:MAG: hypothetical protein ACKN9Q_02415 [Bacteroidota bacterium]
METNQLLIGEVLSNLLLEKGTPCLTITVSLEKLNPVRESNFRILQECVSKAITQWHLLYPDQNDNFFVKPLHDFIEKIDLTHPPEGVGIYISSTQSHYVQFLFSPPLRVDLGNQAFFTGGLDYRYLSPTFKVDSGILSEEATQKMSVLKLGVGIGINF